jgi:hypothetical protein
MVNVTMASAAGWGSPASACGHSIAYRRTALAQINGFARPTLPSGDDDLTIQAIAKAGWNVKFIADSDAVVTDVRIPDLKAKLNATARHQSTTKYYPLTWRVLYLASVISALLVIALPLLSIFWPRLAQVAFVAAVAKVSTDATTALTVSRRLKLGLTLPGAIISAATLPLIALMRAIIFFAPKFQWKSTQYPNTAATPRQPAEST